MAEDDEGVVDVSDHGQGGDEVWKVGYSVMNLDNYYHSLVTDCTKITIVNNLVKGNIIIQLGKSEVMQGISILFSPRISLHVSTFPFISFLSCL